MSKKEKIPKGIYLLQNAPLITKITGYEGVYVFKDLTYPSKIDSSENTNSKRDRLPTNYLKVMEDGDWELKILMINAVHFANRAKLDRNVLAYAFASRKKKPCQKINRISIQKALGYIRTKLWINMEHYMNNINEIEVDLGRKVSELDLENKQIRKRIEEELQMIKIFGSDEKAMNDDNLTPEDASSVDPSDDEDDEENKQEKDPYSFGKAFMLNDFHKYLDGNYMYGTARRGDYYLIFDFGSS